MRALAVLSMALFCTSVLPGCAGPCTELDDELRVRKERARELAVPTGCTSVDRCDALPMGLRACGGPQAYLVFCRDTTDLSALERTLGEIDRQEHGFNQACGIVSACVFIAHPELILVDGRCEPAR